VRDGGANGSIIGRNTFQRPKAEALDMLNKIIKIYLGRIDLPRPFDPKNHPSSFPRKREPRGDRQTTFDPLAPLARG